jgi:methionyl-tRNA synthetase
MFALEMDHAAVAVTSAFPFAPRPLGLSTFGSTYLPADIYARWLGVLGCAASHLTATDVHSIYTSKDGISRDEVLCTTSHERYRQAFADMGIDCAVHETTDHHVHVSTVNAVLHRLLERSAIVQRPANVLRCAQCRVYLPRRLTVQAGPQKHAHETVSLQSIRDNAKCGFCGGTLECVQSNHWFLRLEPFRTLIRDTVAAQQQDDVRNLLASTLLGSLDDWNFSRDNRVGLPIPFDSEGKSLYLWLESLVGYSSMASLAGLVKPPFRHFIGKNIAYFHGIIWPVLLQQGLGYDKFNIQISARGFLDVNKTDPLLRSVHGALGRVPHRDYLRFYLAHTVSDRMVDFSLRLSEMRTVCNTLLIDKIGNLLRRVWALLRRADAAPRRLDTSEPVVRIFSAEIIPRVANHIMRMQVQGALHATMDYVSQLNARLSDTSFRSLKTAEARGRLAFMAASVMTMLRPVIPSLVDNYGFFDGWSAGDLASIRSAVDARIGPQPAIWSKL